LIQDSTATSTTVAIARRTSRRSLVAAAALALVACDSSTGPGKTRTFVFQDRLASGSQGRFFAVTSDAAVIDRARVEQRRAELAPEIEPPAPPADPETALLVRERRGLVRRALALLPRSQRRAALLRFHGELPFQTVAARLGTPEVTARTRVQRALTSLRERLGSLRALVLVPGGQAAVLAITVVAVQFPTAPSPLAIAGEEITVQRPHRRPVRLSARPAAVTAEKADKVEKAQKAPVKMLVPMVFCIFPPLFLIVISVVVALQSYGSSRSPSGGGN